MFFCFLKIQMRVHNLLREKSFFPVHVVGMELGLCLFWCDQVPVFRSLCKDIVFFKQDVVTQVDTVFIHKLFFELI